MPRVFLILVLLPAAACAEETLSIAPDLYAPAQAAAVDRERAAELVDQARMAAELGEVSHAMQLVTQALAHDPDEPTCRRVLGYEQSDGRWLTPFQKKQIARGFIWDTRFGWLKAEDLPRYEAGERPPARKNRGRRWLSVEEDAAQHATIDTGWRVRTDRFLVTTNHSLEAAAELAAELEQLFQVWRQLFAGYYLGAEEIRGRFAGTRRARARLRPLRVVYHRNKAGYVAALRHKQPRIAETLGIYFDDLREAHFYKAEGGREKAEDTGANHQVPPSAFHLPPLRATLYHEAAHQLFQEMARTRKNVGAEANYWLVEGVALYFESLTPIDDANGRRFVIGAAGAGRLPAARRRLASGDYVPLAELSALGRNDLQRRADLAAVYSQSAGLATCLMHDPGGGRRESFVAGVKKLYSGKTRPDDLPRWLDAEGFAELDARYHRYLRGLPPPEALRLGVPGE